jgi:hypothetical protein
VTQVVECLPSKHKSLSSNHSTINYYNYRLSLTLPSRSAEPLSLLLGSPIPWAVPGLSLAPNPLKVRSPPLNRAGLQLPTHTVPEFTPFSCAARSTTTRIPTTHLHQTPAWRWSHRLLSYPTAPPAHCSSGPAEPQLCLR